MSVDRGRSPWHGHRHGKVTAAERARVPHHLLDLLRPPTRCCPWLTSRAMAYAVIADIHVRGPGAFPVGRYGAVHPGSG